MVIIEPDSLETTLRALEDRAEKLRSLKVALEDEIAAFVKICEKAEKSQVTNSENLARILRLSQMAQLLSE